MHTTPRRMSSPPNESKSSPLLRLPPELRLSIYAHVFSVSKSDQQKALGETGGSQHRVWEDTGCPVCGPLYENEGHSFPPCRLIQVSRPKGFAISGSCVRVTRDIARIDHTAILRTCRLVYEEALDVLYENTPFTIFLAPGNYLPPKCRRSTVPRVEPKHVFMLESALFFRRIRKLYLRVVLPRYRKFEELRLETRRLFEHISVGRSFGTSTVAIDESQEALRTSCTLDGCAWHSLEAVVRNKRILCRLWLVEYNNGLSTEQGSHLRELVEADQDVIESGISGKALKDGETAGN